MKASNAAGTELSEQSIVSVDAHGGFQGKASLYGAVLLSAVGSLSLHLIPLIIVVLVADGLVTTAGAGWIASAVLLGKLFSATILPAFSTSVLTRTFALGVVVLLLCGLGITYLAAFYLHIGWFLVGCSSGALMYIGTVSAANYQHPAFAFSLRLGVVLVLSGLAAGALLAFGALASYEHLLLAIIFIFGCVLLLGLVLYHPAAVYASPDSHAQDGSWDLATVLGLAALFVLFVGQTGFLAYVVHGALDRGFSLAEATWAIIAMKVFAGLWLLRAAKAGSMGTRRSLFAELGIVLAISAGVASITGSPAAFLISLLGFEIAFNTLSARFQAAIAKLNPRLTGKWLTATILLGAACGPPLHGAAKTADLAPHFLAFAMLSAILPALWIWLGSGNRR